MFPIRVPPLRERPEDIEALARYFTARYAATLRKEIAGLTPAALTCLQEYRWPGNIRELQNVIERAVILTEGSVVDVDAITVGSTFHPSPVTSVQSVLPFADAERRAIVAALIAAHGRVSGAGGAADLLRLRPTTLHAKMKKLGIRRPGLPGPSAGAPVDGS